MKEALSKRGFATAGRREVLIELLQSFRFPDKAEEVEDEREV